TEHESTEVQSLPDGGDSEAVVDGIQRGHQPRADNGKRTSRNYKILAILKLFLEKTTALKY
ncbi:MAG: hypothetical protein RLZZ452_875, partial [Pseudomonadota bacterium]